MGGNMDRKKKRKDEKYNKMDGRVIENKGQKSNVLEQLGECGRGERYENNIEVNDAKWT